MDADGFDWDSGNWPKCGKHGVSKAEIEFALARGAQLLPDARHSGSEQRFIAIGRNEIGRPLFVGVTFRVVNGEHSFVPSPPRYMHAKEAQSYATQSPGNDNG